jgi:hypothetical protein
VVEFLRFNLQKTASASIIAEACGRGSQYLPERDMGIAAAPVSVGSP